MRFNLILAFVDTEKTDAHATITLPVIDAAGEVLGLINYDDLVLRGLAADLE